jgi:hypothetical protein
MANTLAVLVLLLFGFNASGSDFDRMKMLVGSWEANGPYGKAVVEYKLVSSGNALMETMKSDHGDMVTLYHRDGDGMLATHYCAMGNQPRMRLRKSSGDALEFGFLDVSNRKSPDDPYVSKLVIRFKDADHVVEEYTWTEGGKEGRSEFNLTRVK